MVRQMHNPSGRALGELRKRLEGDAAGRAAALEAYAVGREYTVPFLIVQAEQMLESMKAQQTQRDDFRALFLGRGGTSLSLVIKQLDPEWHEKYAVDVTLSRVLFERALQEREQRENTTLLDVPEFRSKAEKAREVPGENIAGQMEKYLEANNFPVNAAPGDNVGVCVVDTGYKGTGQEMLAAMYPNITFAGEMIFCGEAENDPHPGSKRGTEMHKVGKANKQVTRLPDDLDSTFLDIGAVCALEDTIDGPWQSPHTLRNNRPVQKAFAEDPEELLEIPPERIGEAYSHPEVMETAKMMMWQAIIDGTRDYAQRLASPEPHVRAQLGHASRRYIAQTRMWLGDSEAVPRGSGVDPRFARLANASAHKVGENEVQLLPGMEPDPAALGRVAYRRERNMTTSTDPPESTSQNPSGVTTLSRTLPWPLQPDRPPGPGDAGTQREPRQGVHRKNRL